MNCAHYSITSLLRLVLAQVDVPTLSFESIADWELLQSSVAALGADLRANPSLLPPAAPARSFTSSLVQNYALLSPRRRSFGDEAEFEESGHATSPSAASSSSSVTSTTSLDVARTAKEVVANLNAAMTRHSRYLERLLLSPPFSTRWSDETLLKPLQFMAGVLAGVVVGVTLTKQLLRAPQDAGTSPNLVSKLAKWCSQRAAAADGTPVHLLPFPMDDYSYLMHPAAVEVA
ncbi:hypothetical protein BBJ28_00008332 [Nothophytophthora sp. Chile5]|nr:hypothetical protein BBJ28_00008332 [Nothophytophthora sp. Chile5]